MEKAIVRTLEMNKVIDSVTGRDRSFIRDQLDNKSSTHSKSMSNINESSQVRSQIHHIE